MEGFILRFFDKKLTCFLDDHRKTLGIFFVKGNTGKEAFLFKNGICLPFFRKFFFDR